MTTTLLVIHIIIAVLMIGIVLFQKNEGGGLGMGSSTMGGMMSSRGTANLLTRTTAVLAALFFTSTLGLALVFKGSARQKSLFQETSAPQQNIGKPSVEKSILNNTLTPESKALEETSPSKIVDNLGVTPAKPLSDPVRLPATSKPSMPK